MSVNSPQSPTSHTLIPTNSPQSPTNMHSRNSTVVSPSSNVVLSKLRIKKSNRKQWHETNESNFIDSNKDKCNTDVSFGRSPLKVDNTFGKSPFKDEKWWKYEVDSGDITPTDEHKTWCQSTRITTIKGKRKRKKKLKAKEQGIVIQIYFR